MSWTPEREAEARRLWTAGESASAIARQLGGVTRVAVISKIHRMGLGREVAPAKPKPAAKAKAAPVCAVQGCCDPLSSKNTMGVCLVHKHAAGLCRCPACQGQIVARRVPATDRPGVRSVSVPRTGTSTSGGEARVTVSLPREPWLAGGAG